MKKIIEFQKKYPTKKEKEAALTAMSNAEIDELIADTVNVWTKIYYSKFKKIEKKDLL